MQCSSVCRVTLHRFMLAPTIINQDGTQSAVRPPRRVMPAPFDIRSIRRALLYVIMSVPDIHAPDP